MTCRRTTWRFTSRLAGLSVIRHDFEYDLDLLADWKPPVLDVRRGKHYIPGIAGSIFGGDFGSMVNSPSADVTAPVWAADLRIPSPAANSSTSGCEAADFAGMPAGAIVLLQRGTCAFLDKWLNAQAAGAGAIVQINEGDSPPRTDPLWFDLAGAGVTVPMVAAQIATVRGAGRRRLARAWSARPRALRVDWRPGTYPTENVIAETRGGNPNKVVVVGAHLDSVGTGPGHQRQRLGLRRDPRDGPAAPRRARRRTRSASSGSARRSPGCSAREAYVASLPESERSKIAAMLNFDMIGSPNFVNFVYDGDLSDSPPIDDEVFAPRRGRSPRRSSSCSSTTTPARGSRT